MASRNITTLQDVIVAIGLINNILDKITTGNQDLHGRRIVNAGLSINKLDYITLGEVEIAILALAKPVRAFMNKIDGVISIDNGNVTIQPGKLRILDNDGKVYKLTPVDDGAGGFVVKAELV